jgi:hypothetical protein
MSAKQKERSNREAGDSPTAWFCVLEAAKRKGDRELANRAERELARLGVKVKYIGREVAHA